MLFLRYAVTLPGHRLVVRLIALGCISLHAFSGYCQDGKPRTINQQLTFLNDNNFYLFNGADGYYTNGLFLSYDRLSQNQPTQSKRIISYELGQLIYTAYSRKILSHRNTLNLPVGIEQIDRPIAGYLLGKVTASYYRGNGLIALGLSAGSIGDNSFARNTQASWHRALGIKDHWNWVWDYQVKNEFGINAHATFARSLVETERHPVFQITPVTQATFGTIFTNVSQSVLLQWGKLLPVNTSGYWRSRLQPNSQTEGMELFVYFKPKVEYQVYNATIQGGLLRKDKGPIIGAIEPLVFSNEVGIRLSVPRYDFGYHITFQSREAEKQFHHQSFASIFLACRF